jgi:hypothetical protein
MIGDGARWLCLLGDLVKAKWGGRHHHQHRHHHRHAAASMDPVWSPETPSRAARASAAFRQDSCLQRVTWPPSAALPASAHGPKSLQNHAMLVVGLRAMRQRVFCRLRLRLRYEQRLTVRVRTSVQPGPAREIFLCQPVSLLYHRLHVLCHILLRHERLLVRMTCCTVSVDFFLLNMFLINYSGCWLVAADSCCLPVSSC